MEQAEKDFRKEHAEHGKPVRSHTDKRPHKTFVLTCSCSVMFVGLMKR